MQILEKISRENISDAFALSMTKFFRFIADTFFAKRYGHRAVVLETVAGVPGMVAGVWMHFKSLRKMKVGYFYFLTLVGWLQFSNYATQWLPYRNFFTLGIDDKITF